MFNQKQQNERTNLRTRRSAGILKAIIFVYAVFLLTACAERIPTGVSFHKESIYRTGVRGDNFCLTWAGDGSQITSMCDGNLLTDSTYKYHNRLYRIVGASDNFHMEDIVNYPKFVQKTKSSWFGYGIVSVDGVIYSVISKTPWDGWWGPFRGIKLLKSYDNGETWYRVDRKGQELRIQPDDPRRNEVNKKEMFFLEEFGLPHVKQEAYPFSYLSFVQCGQDQSAAKDEYLYMYSPEGAQSNQLLLARAPSDKLGIRDSWEYFVRYDGDKAIWSSDIMKRGYVHEFPQKNKEGHYFGWYSWLPSVVWNKGLGLYIMVNGGTYAGRGMTNADEDYYDGWVHTKTGSLGFWYSEKPYGPWHRFFYTDYWTVDDPENRTYQPKLSPKWISKDGKEMVLIWSDAMKDENGKYWSTNYRWNQMKITIQMD